jgi:hypothetical protein
MPNHGLLYLCCGSAILYSTSKCRTANTQAFSSSRPRERTHHSDPPQATTSTSIGRAQRKDRHQKCKRIESASFISYIQGDTRQARFGCLGLAVHFGARAPSSWNAEGSVPPPPEGHERKKISQWCEPDERTCLLRALACKTGCVS